MMVWTNKVNQVSYFYIGLPKDIVETLNIERGDEFRIKINDQGNIELVPAIDKKRIESIPGIEGTGQSMRPTIDPALIQDKPQVDSISTD